MELRSFDWPLLIQRWETLASAVLNPDIALEEITEKAQLFFVPGEHGAALSIRFDHGLQRLSPRLIMVRALSPEHAPERIAGSRLASDALKNAVATAHIEVGMDGRLEDVGRLNFRHSKRLMACRMLLWILD